MPKQSEILWRLFRPHTLTASFIPVLLGTIFAWRSSNIFHWGLFLAMMAASVLIQAATNMFNEYFDFKRGLDNENSVGIAGVITRDGIKASTVKKYAWGCLVIAAILGLYICRYSSWWLIPVGFLCMAVGYIYTGGPFPIAYTPFGELIAGSFMGSGIILISFFIQTGSITVQTFFFSIPSLILIGAILMANNIRDRLGDQINGRKTLAVLLGHAKALRFLTAMFIATYLWTIMLVITGILPLTSLLVLLSLPYAYKAVSSYRGKTKPEEMMAGMVAVAQTNTFYGLLMAVGLLCKL
ncbi:MAG: 1,4-dihydroxy-2-naphthoate polyprenyltransferase [Peptococcaceae bacterium]|nr:1,4-dihydroxy-2-naphthoate polyprenyltransferase [Peptococcaceae bacterium]